MRIEIDFLASLARFTEAKTIVEVGVMHGDVAVHLCKAANQNNGKYCGFDVWHRHGLKSQFKQLGSKEAVNKRLLQTGCKGFTLTKIDTLKNRNVFIDHLKQQCPNGIDFAFIDACHSYYGIANDFFAVYPLLTPAGVVAFHDTAKIDGCREFVLDLRTKYNDGTFDVSDYPFGLGNRRCGVSILTKRSYPVLDLGIDEVCGSVSSAEEIEAREISWHQQEIKDKPIMPTKYDGQMLLDKIGTYKRRKLGATK